MKKMQFFIFGFLAALVAGYWFFAGDWRWMFLFVPLAGFYVFGLMKKAIVLWFVVGVVLGFGRYYLAERDFLNLGDEVISGEFYGCIVREVDVRSDHVKYTLGHAEKGDLLRQDRRSLLTVSNHTPPSVATPFLASHPFSAWPGEVQGVLVLVNGPRYPVYDYGDCMRFEGDLRRPEPVEDFRYDLYLKRFGVGYVVSYPDVLAVEEGDEGFWGFLYRLKVALNRRIGELFGEPTGSLVSGLLLGSRKGMSEELTADLQITGLAHIVAISGYNITILVLFVGMAFGFLSRKWKVVCSILAIVLFVLLVGAGASVVRAAIMGGIGLLALFYGRQYFVSYALLLAAFVMALWNPFVFTFDSGFHFSFLATMGLIYLSPVLEGATRFLPDRFLLKETFLLTISAQVMVLPLAIANFGGFSWISPVVNLLVLPFIPVIMLLAALALFLSFVNFSFGMVLAFVVRLVVNFVIGVVEFFADLSFGFWRFEDFSWWFGGGYYLLLFMLILKHRNNLLVPT